MKVIRFPCWSWDSARCSEVSTIALLFRRTVRLDGDSKRIYLEPRRPYFFGTAKVLPFRARR